MKRYFTSTVNPNDCKWESRGQYHWIKPDDSQEMYYIVMLEESSTPMAEWTEAPHLLENTAVGWDIPSHGVNKTHTMYQAAKLIAKHCSLFHP